MIYSNTHLRTRETLPLSVKLGFYTIPGLKGGFRAGGGKLLSFVDNPQSPTFFIEYTPITGLEKGGGDRGYLPPITPCLTVCYFILLKTRVVANY